MTAESQIVKQYTPGELFDKLLQGRWGLMNLYTSSGDTMTIQNVDYTTTTNPLDYGKTWVVRDAVLASVRDDGEILLESVFQASLFLSVGPNASTKGTDGSIRKRTQNLSAAENYDFFQKGIRASVDSTLDAMISEGVDIAYLGKFSHGLYSGRWLQLIGDQYPKIVKASLEAAVTARGHTRVQVLKQVFIVDREADDFSHQPESSSSGRL